jgi:hypothetical protein
MDFMRPPDMSFTDGGSVDLAAPPVDEIVDVEFTDVTADPAIELDPLETRRLMSRLKIDLGHARDKKKRVDERCYLDRQAYDLDPKATEYEGQPDLTTPGTRAKVDSVNGHMMQTINQKPFFAATSHTPEAVEIAPVYETALERELELADSKARLLDAPLEAGIVGTAIVGFELVERPSGELAVQLKLTRLENFSCYPVAVDDFSSCTTFRRFKLPWWKLRDMARTGLYDMEAVLALKGNSGGDNLTKEEGDDNSGGDSTFDENRMVELYEAFYRYAPTLPLTQDTGFLGEVNRTNVDDGSEAVLWQVIFSEQHERPLALRENPYRVAFDAPPYTPVRLSKKSGYVWGTSIPTLMRAPQKMEDDGMNDTLAYNQFARTPVIEVDRNSSLFRTYGESGGYKFRPGDMIPRNGPQNSGVNVVQLPHAVNAERQIIMGRELGDLVTFNDHMLQGDNYAPGRRTKYEVQSAYGSSATKLKNYLYTFANDMKLVGKMAWAMLDAFKVEPEGVYSVYDDGATALLSSDGIPANEMQMLMQAALPELTQDPETAQEASENIRYAMNGAVVQLGNIKLIKGAVPSTRRDDITFGLAGTSISADRQAKANAVTQFAPFMQMLQFASQDTRIWHILKDLLEGLDLLGWEKWLGPDPTTMDPQAFALAMQAQQEATATSTQL